MIGPMWSASKTLRLAVAISGARAPNEYRQTHEDSFEKEKHSHENGSGTRRSSRRGLAGLGQDCQVPRAADSGRAALGEGRDARAAKGQEHDRIIRGAKQMARARGACRRTCPCCPSKGRGPTERAATRPQRCSQEVTGCKVVRVP